MYIHTLLTYCQCPMYLYCICLIRRYGYYLLCHAILCGYYSRAAFIKLRGIATVTNAEIEESDPFSDNDEDENEMEESEVVLEDCSVCHESRGFVHVRMCYSNKSHSQYLRAVTISFSTSASVASIREQLLIESGV